MQLESREEILTNLGLTLSQAKVYLALVHGGPAKVTQISSVTGIHRAHIYEILHFLQEKGFIEKSLENTTYIAAPIKEIALILVNKKRQEISTLEKERQAIAEVVPQKPTPKNKPAVVLTSNKNLTLNKVEKFILTSKKEMISMHTWKRFCQIWQHFEGTLAETMKRGVTARHIVEFPQNMEQAHDFLQREIFKHKNFELKFVPVTGGNFTVIDHEMLLLSTNQEGAALGENPFIFSNYVGLVRLMEGYFKTAWKTGIDFRLLNEKAPGVCEKIATCSSDICESACKE